MAGVGDLAPELGEIVLRSDPNGGATVLESPSYVAISVQLLAESCSHLMRVDAEGVISIAGQARYRPERLSSDGRSLVCRLVD